MAKYDPLEAWLKRRGGTEVELTFADVERIIGGMLPNSAQRSQWWANESDPKSRHVQSRAWRNAGYDALPVADEERVRFRKRTLRDSA